MLKKYKNNQRNVWYITEILYLCSVRNVSHGANIQKYRTHIMMISNKNLKIWVSVST